MIERSRSIQGTKKTIQDIQEPRMKSTYQFAQFAF